MIAHSAIAEADISDFDFDKIFEGADWFHFVELLLPLAIKQQNLQKQH